MSEWEKLELSEVIDIKHGYAYKGKFFCEEDTREVVLTPGNFKIGGGFKANKFKFYNGPIAEDYVLSEGDLLVTMTDLSKAADTLGYPALIPSIKGYRFHHNQRLGLVSVLDQERHDRVFIYYLLCSPIYHNEVVATATGSTVKHTSPTKIRQCKADFPTISAQKKIAHILSTLDDKIALNRKLNATLEAMAQALFQSWFVDFDPVKAKLAAVRCGRDPEQATMAAIACKLVVPPGKPKAETLDAQLPSAEAIDAAIAALADLSEAQRQSLKEKAAHFPADFQESELGLIPLGWRVKQIESILELLYGKALKKTERISGVVPVYGSGGVNGYHNKPLVEGPGVIVGRKGTIGSLYWEPSDFFPIDTVFYIKPKGSYSLSWVYYLMGNLGLADMNTDAAVPGLNRKNVYRLEVTYGSVDLVRQFSNCIDEMRGSIDCFNNESRTLANLRDALLPKLLSGEISVSPN